MSKGFNCFIVISLNESKLKNKRTYASYACVSIGTNDPPLRKDSPNGRMQPITCKDMNNNHKLQEIGKNKDIYHVT